MYVCAASVLGLEFAPATSPGWFELSGSWNLAIFILAETCCQVCPALDKVQLMTRVRGQGGGAGFL